MGETELEVKALYALEKIVEEAADKRWPVSNDRVKEAQKRFEELAEKDTEVSDELIRQIQKDLRKLDKMTDGAPKKPIDHMSVQTDLVDAYADELVEKTNLLS